MAAPTEESKPLQVLNFNLIGQTAQEDDCSTKALNMMMMCNGEMESRGNGELRFGKFLRIFGVSSCLLFPVRAAAFRRIPLHHLATLN